MGIRGLNTFFNNNPDLSKSHKLFDTPVIIDGNNLIHLLYFRNKVDCIYGGDYNKYAAAIKKYLSSFIECNIRPIIIFDGGYDKSDRKYHTVLLRSRTRLTLTQHIAKYGQCSGNILPINAQEVFRNVLTEMDIPFAQCDFEADDQITALANYYDCPVLSDDSDFYIFDIHKGFIRLASVETTITEMTHNDASYKYLRCEIYHIDKFLSYFPGIDRNVLPLFGTLVGNDFVESKDFASFFSNVQLPKLKSKGLRINDRQKKIMGLLSWLKDFTLDDGIHQVLSHIKIKRRDRVKYVIDQSIKSYRTEKCNLTSVIDGKLKDLEEDLNANVKLTTLCGEVLPIPFVILFHRGKLPSFFLNIINLHRIFLPSQVEDVSLESSYICSRYIRQIIYGFLLQHPVSDEVVHNFKCLAPIEEFDRRNGSLQRERVEPALSLRNGATLPDLNSIYGMEKNALKNIILNVLDVEASFISLFPANLQLLFACISYWLKNCYSKPREEFLYALIINLIYFNYIVKRHLQKHGDNNGNSSPTNPKDFAIMSVINTLSETDVQVAAQNMKKYVHKPVLNMANPLILHIVHSYSELQTCILYSMYLNMLLGCPFEHPKLHECFSGTLLYNLTKELMSRPFPDLFTAELLGRQSGLATVFSVIRTQLLEHVPPDSLITIDRSELSKGKKKKNKTKHQKEGVRVGDEFTLSKKFQCLKSSDENSFFDVMDIEHLSADFSTVFI